MFETVRLPRGLGGGDDEQYVECSDVDSAKRPARRELNKVAQLVVG
ncbi:hypothetical protein ABZ467_27265 [Streptomyces sp. NPDC005727]